MIEQLRFHIYEFKARPGDLGSMIEDHERLASCRSWLLRCVRKLQARGGESG